MKRSEIRESPKHHGSMDGHRMVLYRRNRIPGGTYFFTVTLRDRKSTLLVDHIDELRAAFRAVKRARPFRIRVGDCTARE